MKIKLLCACLTLALSACGSWPLHTTPYNPPTIVPSRTPSIQTATPVILSPVAIATTAAVSTGTPPTESPTSTFVAATPSDTITPIVPTPGSSISATILGCDTSIDILHGMGEVTNAYVKITNTTAADAPNLCATLRALDEGRPHPDKTQCVPSLPAGYQVGFKLTVDSTYKANTPVQVDITAGGSLLQRLGEAACTAIGVLPPDLDGLRTPQVLP